MLVFDDGSKCLIPIHANLVFGKLPNTNINFSYLNGAFIDVLARFLNDNSKYTVFYLDFSKIVEVQARIFKKLKKLNSISGKVVFFNIKYKRIEMQVLNELIMNLPSNSIFEIIDNKDKKEIKSIYKISQRYFNKIIKDITIEPDEKIHYLESSNVFLNKYVQIKEIFKNQDQYKKIIYKMINIIEENYNANDVFQFDILVSSSLTGAALATCISSLIKVPTLHFHNLGPKFALYNSNLANTIQTGKRYLFIYDFICLGTEYRLTKGFIEQNGGVFIGACGISSFAKPKIKINKLNETTKEVKAKYDQFLKINSIVYIQDVVKDYMIFTRLEEGLRYGRKK